ncbi:MAG: adenosine deaminase [Spirochaetes bacterium]|nr:MAG: adenosine deaminase [Spirochaetota bacterium]RLD36414.1 MAG: adenosine deaminase [Bacteroidota bacterium]
MISERLQKIIRGIPKAELHLHIEGSIPWKLVPVFIERNKLDMPFSDMKGALSYRKKYLISRSSDRLSTFIDMIRVLSQVLVTKEDYRDTLLGIARESSKQNIVYQELMFVYSFSEDRGISLETVVEGYREGIRIAKEIYGIEIVLIANIDNSIRPLRSLKFVKKLEEYKDVVVAIGVDSEAIGFPNYIHEKAFELAKEIGLYTTCHAGEFVGAESVWEAIKYYKIDRIDHGVRAIEDERLLSYLGEHQIPLTLCPSSNIDSRIFSSYGDIPIRKFLDENIPITINSDNPPWLGMNLIDEFSRIVEAHSLSEMETINIIKDGFKYSVRGQKSIELVDEYLNNPGK